MSYLDIIYLGKICASVYVICALGMYDSSKIRFLLFIQNQIEQISNTVEVNEQCIV